MPDIGQRLDKSWDTHIDHQHQYFKYVTDHEFPRSPFTGKSPWVTLNGEELHDSQLIVEALTRKFGKDCK